MPQATPAPIIKAAGNAGGAARPGNSSQTRPAIANVKPIHWRGVNRAPVTRLQLIMVTCTAPNSSSAPVAAVSDR